MGIVYDNTCFLACSFLSYSDTDPSIKKVAFSGVILD